MLHYELKEKAILGIALHFISIVFYSFLPHFDKKQAQGH